jgi:hypothetical protein
MKMLARILLVFSVLLVLSGFASCHHYYTVSLPPEASLPDWDGEAHWESYGWMNAAIILLSGGAVSCVTGFYLHGKTKRIHRLPPA